LLGGIFSFFYGYIALFVFFTPRPQPWACWLRRGLTLQSSSSLALALALTLVVLVVLVLLVLLVVLVVLVMMMLPLAWRKKAASALG
jgi:hypothetical protein